MNRPASRLRRRRLIAISETREQAWHRRARRARQQARLVLGVARARATILDHHGGGGVPMSRRDKQYDRALARFQHVFHHGLSSKGQGKSGHGVDGRASWNCATCAKFNFEFRNKCIVCGEPGPHVAAQGPTYPTTKKGTGKGGGKKGKGGGKGGEGGDSKGSSIDKASLEAKVKSLEEECRTLKAQCTGRKKDEGEDEDLELIDAEGEEDQAVAWDLENLAGLQKVHDAALAALGPEEASVKSYRERLDAARARQRAAKPVMQQVHVAQRRTTRLEKQLEGATKKLEELEFRKKELEEEISEQKTKVETHQLELDKSRVELGGLLERAKAEKGSTTQQAAEDGNTGGGGVCSAESAWGHAKAAIGHRLASLGTAEAQALGEAIKAQFQSMESILNRLPTASANAAGIGSAATPAAATAAAAAAKPEHSGSSAEPPAEDKGNGGGGGGEGAIDDGDQTVGMLDLDEDTVDRLAEIFGVDAVADEGGDDRGNADGEGGGGERSGRKKHRFTSKQMAAATAVLGKVPIRKTFVKGIGKP